MDRATVYAGQIPLETDILKTNQFAMVGLAKLSESVLGTGTYVSGFTFTPQGGTLVGVLGPGVIYQQENLEQSTWSSMPTVSNNIEKQGILLNSVNLTFTPPGTVGQSQNFLIEVQYSDVDTGSVVLPYYNAAAPTVPFSGPGGAGTAQNTIRQGAVAYQIKAGTAATSGTQVTPAPDAGWTGLFVVTLAQGATAISGGNISTYSGAPFIPVTLPLVPAGVQAGQWIYSPAGGSVNAYTATLVPALTAFTVGSEILVNFGTPNTSTTPVLNVNGLGNKTIVKQSGAAVVAGDVTGYVPLIYDGANWRINGFVKSDVLISSSSSTIKAPKLIGLFATQTGASGTSIPASAATNVAFNATPVANNLSGTSTFNGTTLTVGAGEGGIWSIVASVHMPVATAYYCGCSIYKNGSIFISGTTTQATSGTGQYVQVAASISLAAGDTITIAMYQQSGGAITTTNDNGTNFSAFLISAV